MDKHIRKLWRSFLLDPTSRHAFIFCNALARAERDPLDVNMHPFAAQNERELLVVVKNLSGASKLRPFLAMLRGVAQTFNKELEELTLLDLIKLGKCNFPVGRINMDYVEAIYHNLGLELSDWDAKRHFCRSLSMFPLDITDPWRRPCSKEMMIAIHVVGALLESAPPMNYEELRLFIKQSDLQEQIYSYFTPLEGALDGAVWIPGPGFMFDPGELDAAGCMDYLVTTIYDLLDSLCIGG